jgi:hypothetical protein
MSARRRNGSSDEASKMLAISHEEKPQPWSRRRFTSSTLKLRSEETRWSAACSAGCKKSICSEAGGKEQVLRVGVRVGGVIQREGRGTDRASG